MKFAQDYRPEIDGLRALAVISVIFYHAKLGNLSGGYLGVDVFFVISGFLITRNILSDQAKGIFSIGEFYIRRSRRILPLLFTVLIITSYYAWRYILPADFIDYSASVLSTLGFISNIFFFHQDNYHAAESITKPLLHTWSLGVEEQFYLLFPIFLLLINQQKAFKKFLLISIIAIASLAFAHNIRVDHPEFNFYLLPSRLWELLAGSLLAFSVSGENQQHSPKNSLISISGILLIGGSNFYINNNMPHPSLLTLVPVAGAVAVIGWGRGCKFTAKILGNYGMTWLGRLSYSLYLWHFPVFAFGHIKSNEFTLGLSDVLKLLTITLILSVVSHYLIERPFRNRAQLSNKFVFSTLTVVAIMLLSFSLLVIKNKGLEQRLGDIASIFSGADRNDSFLKKNGDRCYFNFRDPKSCKFDDLDDATALINIGDSHANMISVPLSEFALDAHFNFYNMILSHCPYVESAWRETGFKAKCETSHMEELRDYLKTIPPSIIVYTARWPMYLNHLPFDNGEGGKEQSLFFPLRPSKTAQNRGDKIEDLIVKTFNNLSDMGHTVIIIYPTPEVGWHVPKLIKEHLDKVSNQPLGRKRNAFENLQITTSYEVFKKRTRNAYSILDRAEGNNIFRVYPEKIFCSEQTGRCVTHNKTNIFYYDDDHLSQVGASLLVDKISEVINATIK